MRSSRATRAGLALLVVVLVLLGVQLARVHESTGELRLTPSATPPTLHELGRDYRRSSSAPSHRLPRDTQEIGETPGGGELFGPRHITTQGVPRAVVPTVLWVRDDDGAVWSYALSGGP